MPPKPQPWYASLNQPARNPKDGRYRRASAQAHRDPIDRTDSSPRADDAADALAYGVSPTQSLSLANWTTRHFALAEPKPPAVPYAGVRAGELIGYRMWPVMPGNTLCSLAHHFLWEPGATIYGDVDEPVEGQSPWAFSNPVFGGTYSFSSRELLAPELVEIEHTDFPCMGMFGVRVFSVNAVAIGTIKCWGEVVEHEKGYRAQYAKLHSIDRVIGKADIHTLRERYGV